MPTLYETLRADIITAMKARDSARATILRTADAAVQRSAMDLNKPIDDTLVLATLRKSVKNLTDASEEFARGGRIDLVSANQASIANCWPSCRRIGLATCCEDARPALSRCPGQRVGRTWRPSSTR
jgi:hypothetical protein